MLFGARVYGRLLTCCCCAVGIVVQDIIEGKEAFTIRADAPGFTPEDIAVEMNEGNLTISGKRKEERVEEKDGKVRDIGPGDAICSFWRHWSINITTHHYIIVADHSLAHF